jgi:hypothetical protein
LCDWDNKGIEIYQDIKKNIFPNIEIIVPQEPIKFLDIRSEWKTKIDFSLFSNEAQTLLGKIKSKISILYSVKVLFSIFSSFNHLRIIIFNNLCTI